MTTRATIPPTLPFSGAVELVQQICDQWTKYRCDPEVVFYAKVRGHRITIFQQDPPDEAARQVPFMKYPPDPLEIAQLRYQPASRIWQLFWMRKTERWCLYDAGVTATPDVGVLLQQVVDDAYGCFWG